MATFEPNLTGNLGYVSLSLLSIVRSIEQHPILPNVQAGAAAVRCMLLLAATARPDIRNQSYRQFCRLTERK